MRFGWVVAAGVAVGLAGMTGMADAQAPRGEDIWPDKAVPEEEAATAGRRVMPLTQEHIRLLGELVRQQQRATLEGAGFFPAGKQVQAAVRSPSGRVERFGPVVAGRRGSGFHLPLVTGRSEVLRLMNAAMVRDALISNEHNSVWNRVDEKENRSARLMLEQCTRR